MALLAPDAGRAHVVGVTGAPGVGKSTTTNALVTAYRARGQPGRGARRRPDLAVLRAEPCSATGSGCRSTRADPEVFIRSMASRGHLGGLSWAAPQALRVLDAAGCDVVLLETVGVGQSEVEVAGTADTTVVLLAPGMGDGIQAAKAGILEVADVLVVNKADREGADRTVRDLRHAVSLGEHGGETRAGGRRWCARSRPSGTGVEDVVAAVDDAPRLARRRRAARASGAPGRPRDRGPRARRAARAGRRRCAGTTGSTALADDVVAGRTDPYAAADRARRRAHLGLTLAAPTRVNERWRRGSRCDAARCRRPRPRDQADHRTGGSSP